MHRTDLLLNVNSFHLELLRPLVKWKVLSIKELFEDSNYAGSYKNFHKIIARLEKHKVLEGFKDVWTKSKRIYLTSQGNQVVNPQHWRADVYNKNALFHDSRVTLYLRHLVRHLEIPHIELDQERMKAFKFFANRPKLQPDAEFGIIDKNSKGHRLYLEVELTQKEFSRISEKLDHYQDVLGEARVIFLFPTESLATSYRKIFESLKKENAKSQFIFAVEQGLIQGNFSLEKTMATVGGRTLTLQNYFAEIGGGLKGDYKEKIERIWRSALEKFF